MVISFRIPAAAGMPGSIQIAYGKIESEFT